MERDVAHITLVRRLLTNADYNTPYLIPRERPRRRTLPYLPGNPVIPPTIHHAMTCPGINKNCWRS